MRRAIATAALVIAALSSGASVGGVAAQPPPASEGSGGHGRGVDLAGDIVLPPGGARPGAAAAFRVRHWPGRTIRYHETLPAKWQWSLDTAVRHWNETGANIKLVKVPKRRSQLVIRYGPTYGADGVGTLGYAPGHNVVHLSTKYKRIDEHDPEQRAWVARLLAHEIGHNLGYDHTRGRCDLMVAYFFFGPCGPLSPDKPGYYRCRIIDKTLLRRHIKVYGGRARQQPVDCLLAPLPPQLRDVTATGGEAVDNSLVRLSWRVPRPPAGARIRVHSWGGAPCDGAVPRWAASRDLPATATSWTETEPGSGPWCYSVQIRNRYGAARPAVTRSVVRTLPVPDAPVVTSGPTFDPEERSHRFRATIPTGTSLVAMRDASDPERCVTTYDEGDPAYSDYLDMDDDGWYVVYPDGPEECLVLFAVDDEGLASEGVELRLSVPAPAVAPTLGPVRVDEWGDHVVRVSLGANPHGYDVVYEVVAGGCPHTAPDPDHADYADLEGDTYLWTYEAGPHCAVFAAIDGFGRTGPVASVSFTAT